MVSIWCPMKERGTKMLYETGRGEIHAQTLGLSGRIPGNWCSQCAMATAISTEGAVKNSPIHLFWFLHCFYNNFYRLGKQTNKLPCCKSFFTIAHAMHMSPSSQTWQWKIPHLVRWCSHWHLHLLGISQPCLIPKDSFFPNGDQVEVKAYPGVSGSYAWTVEASTAWLLRFKFQLGCLDKSW